MDMRGIAGKIGIALLIGRNLAVADMEFALPVDAADLGIARYGIKDIRARRDEPAEAFSQRKEGANEIALERRHSAIPRKRPGDEIDIGQTPALRKTLADKTYVQGLAYQRMGTIGADQHIVVGFPGAGLAVENQVIRLKGLKLCLTLHRMAGFREEPRQDFLRFRLFERQKKIEAVADIAGIKPQQFAPR